LALWLCVHALGGKLPFVQVGAVYLGGHLVAAPLPCHRGTYLQAGHGSPSPSAGSASKSPRSAATSNREAVGRP
jgi:hypothetical protein